ncbi:partial two-component system, NarL family, sensor histidine kinase EvgS, partial [Anaerolineae bacterium]
IICDEAGYRMAWVGYAENDDAKTVRPVAWAGFEDGYLASANITWADTERGRGPAGTAIRRGESICIQDFAADPQAAPWRASALPRGYRSSIALPLKDENAKTFGVLNIYSMELNAFTPDEIRLLDELAGDLAFGIGVLHARTERRRAEEALRQEHQNYVTLVNSIDGIVWEADAQTFAFNFVSHQAERLLGYPIERWLTEPTFWKDHLHPDDQEWAVNFCMQAVREKRPHDFEYRMLAADGRVVWMRDIVTIVVANDQPVRLRGIMLDTTERRRAEEALRESEEVYRKLIAASPDAITGTDLAGQITLVSPKAIEMFGLSPDDNVLERSIFDWVAPEDMERAAANMQHLLTTGQMRYREFVLRKKDGTYFDGEVNAALIQAADGTPKGTIIITRDITERKRAEQKANQLAAIVQSSEDAIIGKTLDGIITSWNRGAEKIYGYAESEVIGKPISILVLPSHEDQVPQILEKIKAGEHIEHYEAVRRRKDGREIQMSLTISPVRDAEGKIVAASTIGRDITERQRAEQERLAHLRFFETMDQINRAMQGTNDLEQMMSDVLDVVLSIFGCDRAWLVNPCDPETVSWQVPMERTRPGYPGAFDIGREIPTAPDVVRTFRILLDSEGPVKFGPASEYPLPEEIAKQFGIQSQIAMAIYSKVDKPYVFGLHQCSYPRIWTPEEERLFQEIGRRLSDSLGSLLMYRNLRESERKYRLLAENISDVIWILDLETNDFRYVSPSVERLRGYTAEEVLAQNVAYALTPESLDYIARVTPPRMEAFRRGIRKSYRDEIAQPRKDGTIVVTETIVSFQSNIENGHIEALGVSRDITERKRAEEALHKSEEQYRIVADNTHDWEFWSSPDGQFLYNSPSCQRITGHTADEFAREPGLLNRIIHPEDRERFMLHFHQVMERKMPGEIEFRLLLEDGSVRHIGHVCQPVFDAQGLYLGERGSNRDITERKQAEEALRASEARFRALVENSSEIITILNADGTARYESPAHERVLGYTLDEMIGAYPLALVHPEDLPRLLDIFVTGIQVPKYTAQAEYRIRHKDGTWRTMEMVACNLLEDPAVEGIVVNSRDITERMSAEAELAKYREHLEELVAERTQQLRESEQHYRQLFETMLQGVVYQDANGKIISMNPAAERILGVTSAELLGTISMENKSDAYREDGSLLPKPEHPATVTQLTGEEVHNVVMGIYNPRAQSQRWINVSAVPVFRSGEDKPYQVYTLFDDITERKLAEVQIRKLNQDLQERAVALEAANKELEAFAYSVSHDLRAPLRHIDGFLELFQTKTAFQLDERSQHYLENISDAAKRMGTLIDDLLSFSRMGRYEMSKLRVDLGGLTHEVIREFEPETGGRNIHWQIADLPVVTGDRAMLRIVLVNLISNALKFTQPREQTEIEIGWMREEETGTVIFVRDNGVGFDPRYADKLFGVFQRLHRADEFEGTGIGLANVRRIISRHGGRTWAEGQVNQGATVYFSLPQTNQGG